MTHKSMATAALAVAALAGGAGTVSAATLSIEGNTLVLHAKPAERNVVAISRDRSGDIAVRNGCRDDPTSSRVLCLRFRVGRVRLELGDGDDQVRVEDSVPTFVDAGAGNDTVTAIDVRVDPATDLSPTPSRVDFTGGGGRYTASFANVADARVPPPGVTVTNDDRPGDGRPIDAN